MSQSSDILLSIYLEKVSVFTTLISNYNQDSQRKEIFITGSLKERFSVLSLTHHYFLIV